MRVVAVSTLRAFWERFPDAEQPLKAWYEEVKSAAWTQPAEIKAQYRSASVLKNRRVVFNIKGQ
jgi:mRNA interferase HigB